ncbi:hypothetical protein BJF93_19950 [Xaviernesmea oryzae]|uniref:SnoaL-like domain-containing protein n=1 Tax=Xaviernesmea oryzae TaxID=464029 RepID=A0A1Q9AYS3_9HYPH|nr:nuclear transport factor 2 family protein [Xaviernesmea oryzae]OLP60597.1 hypothetical protein BJF93_19950 [Xaviernesmea oryzae]SEM32657.1 conserved hypothetical protein, steroid delta-isomerase-related [Xaviernesmea oryzae]
MLPSPFDLCVRRQMLLAGLLLAGLPLLAHAAPPTPSAIVARYVAAWNAHDPDAATAMLAPDSVYFNSSLGQEQEARAAIDGTMRGLFALLPDLHWRMIEQPIESASGIAFEWEVSGAYKADGQAATKPIRLRGASLFRVRDARISYLADYYDSESMRRQLDR